MIAVLGSGISGLMAAWACSISNKDFVIFSNKIEKPGALGFQYLHDSCHLELFSFKLTERIVPFFNEISNSIIYSLKVYGSSNTKNSLNKFRSEYRYSVIYNLNEAIDKLWKTLSNNIHKKEFNDLKEVEDFSSGYDLVISTIPVSILDKSKSYNYASSYVTTFPVETTDNEVFYDLNLDSKIHRFGHLFGNFFFESSSNIIPYSNSTIVRKVISTDKLPSLHKVVFVGRYGAWNKDELAHTVFRKITKILNV